MGRIEGPRILVAGLGNELLRDDAVGIHAVRLLNAQRPEEWGRNIVVAEVGVAGLDALDLFDWADHILAVDAMRAGKVPGSLYLAYDSDIEDWDPTGGLHEFSLVGALRMIKKKPQASILGVEPEIIDYGMELSDTLRRVLPRVAADAQTRLRTWNTQPSIPEWAPSVCVRARR